MAKSSPLRIIAPQSPPSDPLDPTGLGTMPVAPLVPSEVLAKHKCLVATDTRFRAAARLLQSVWRDDHELPIGVYTNAEGKRVKLGSRLTEATGRTGANFLSYEITHLARRECIYRELGALIEVDRLRINLLSSMPLTFNLFAPLKLDLRQATRFMDELFPGLMGEVRAIRFEHSPGRGKEHFTGDYSAFDLAIYGLSATGKRVLVAIEVKYSESGSEPAPIRISDRQLVITPTSGNYLEPEDPALLGPALQQLTRELNLAQSILDHGDVDEAIFVLASPRLNSQVTDLAEAFVRRLTVPGDGRARFVHLTLERLVEALLAIGMVAHAQAFHRRYLDFWQVDGQLELEVDASRAEKPSKPKEPKASEPSKRSDTQKIGKQAESRPVA